jgi:CHASE3 domain sensor protein
VRVIVAVAAFLALIVLLALVAWFNVGQQQGADLVEHTLRVENGLDRILLSVADAETGQRGFLLTGDESYLSPFPRASSKIDLEIRHLNELVSDSPSQLQRLANVKSLVGEKFDELNDTIALYRGGNPHEARQLVLGGTGKTVMDALRAEIAAMKRAEAALLRIREDALDRVGYALSAALLVGAVFAFALAVWVAGRQRRQIAVVVASEQGLRDANRRLVDEAAHRQRVRRSCARARRWRRSASLPAAWPVPPATPAFTRAKASWRWMSRRSLSRSMRWLSLPGSAISSLSSRSRLVSVSIRARAWRIAGSMWLEAVSPPRVMPKLPCRPWVTHSW